MPTAYALVDEDGYTVAHYASMTEATLAQFDFDHPTVVELVSGCWVTDHNRTYFKVA